MPFKNMEAFSSGMVNAVVMAGMNPRQGFFQRMLSYLEDQAAYGENYLSGVYKPSWRVNGEIDGARVRRPMVEFMLDRLEHTRSIDQIIVVAPTDRLEEALEDRVHQYSKMRIVEQGRTFGENAILGYEAAGGGHVLFCTSDAPRTTTADITEFLSYCKQLQDTYDIIYPVVSERVYKHGRREPKDRPRDPVINDLKTLIVRFLTLPVRLAFPAARLRPFTYLLPLGIYPEDYCKVDGYRDERGREGFRITSMMMANLEGITPEFIDRVYSLRKTLKWSVLREIKQILGPGIVRRYLQGITAGEAAGFVEQYINKRNQEPKRIQIVGLSRGTAEFDVDGMGDVREL